ncbi:hypothetical protein [Alkalihalobacillus sp. CinArs1]|uniref:hypothetical protein n=1 Tax=Alkalihalobacillus sp. CinArs1 TaxID=2995314 RepID=UPI0022DDFD6E|nr:hypothetical protein [Alkalihalobacillus sp. CinArs1]
MNNYYAPSEAEGYFVMALVIGIGLFVFCAIVWQIFCGIGLMRMAERLGIKNGWFAFVPILNHYTMGEVVSEKLKNNGGTILIVMLLSAALLGWIPILGIFVIIAYLVVYYISLYWIYEKFSNQSLIMLILSIIFPVITPFFIFAIRKNEIKNINSTYVTNEV